MIVIPGALISRIVAQARQGKPDEVCGWLAGEGNRVREVFQVPNVAEDPRMAFEMDPEAQLSTMRKIRDLGLDLTGTYHSHPRTPALPSTLDRKLSAYPEAAHFIVSLFDRDPDVRCYRINGEGFSRMPLHPP